MGVARRIPRPTVRLVHWNAREAASCAAALRRAGYRPDASPLLPDFLHDLRARPPSAVVIDLSRLPSQGRDVGIAMRQGMTTRAIPLVFVGGDPEKVDRARAMLPDATYAPWADIARALHRAIASPPGTPVAPASRLAGYAGTPLPRKLGIKPGAVVQLLNAPREFERTLGKLPEGASLHRGPGGRRDLTLWFLTSQRDLAGGIVHMAARVGRDGMWIAWPKRASRIASDLTQQVVRATGLAHGLVDYKICAIDDTWSALKFTTRKPSRIS